MPKKRTRSEKQRAQMIRQQRTTPAIGTSPASSASVPQLAPALQAVQKETMAGILSAEQQQYLLGDIFRSLMYSAVIGLLLFGIFLYVINAVQ